MLTACWTTKGGSGVTVVAASLGLLFARTAPAGACVVDLAGDVPLALGLPPRDRSAPGVAGWLAAAPDVPADALARLELPAAPGLGVVPRGAGELRPAGADLLVRMLTDDRRPVVVDCGRVDAPEADAALVVAAGADRSLLVLRQCYLGLRRAVDAPLRPSGVVLVVEEGRAITAGDVEDSLGVPVIARVRVSDVVARAVDAGLLVSRMPRGLARDLRHAA